jgi:hypothetical protein
MRLCQKSCHVIHTCNPIECAGCEQENVHAKPITTRQTLFHKVTKNLCRLKLSGGHYARVKKSGKQFRCSRKTKDRKLPGRRSKNVKDKSAA